MQKLNQPPQGSRIQVKYSDRQIRIRLPDEMALSLIGAAFAIGLSALLIRQGLIAWQTESIGTGAVWLPWVVAAVSLAIAGFLLTSRPTFYIDPPAPGGTFRFQWAVGEIAIEAQALHLQLFTPLRRRWVHIPLTAVDQLHRVDEIYWAMGRRSHDRYCILRTREGDYMLGASLSSQAQDWLVSELSAFLPQVIRKTEP
ncbi:hypothetical protein BST81_12780 [Leptolyngbya sp. 'hensonii']|uniref:hypothetical protein n=1 Tax=Leptolyngbya sp. 'hensonii' TaxID=1922337 RepID=UPI00094F8A98|nr:hypothetical protein [Leptolyngbya sp. 'hensonii']OLP17926.1 hypothetical protein BST81_12780 [Leptolyngbya sp. 'hensonii']